MHYSQFCSAISDILRKNSDPGTQFIQKTLCKNNGVCPDVLFALPADSALGPVVYLEPLYDQYQKGIPILSHLSQEIKHKLLLISCFLSLTI